MKTMTDSAQNDFRIKMVCQCCGFSWDEIRAWSPRCYMHGGPVCMACCSSCEYRVEFSGVHSCGFKDPLTKLTEAKKRIRSREAQANAEITEAYMKKRREIAKKNAIKKNVENKRKNNEVLER